MSKYYDKTAASFKSVTIDTKVLDAQKILVNPATGDSTERVNILELINDAVESVDTTELELRISALEDVVAGYKSVEFKSNTTGNSNETEGIAMQFSQSHFIPGNAQLQLVSLPFTQEPNALPNQYCHIWYYNDAAEVIAIHISNITQSRTQGQTGKSTWTFPESCIVPESYKYARVFLSGVDYTVDFGRTSKYRINVVNRGGVDFDDDDCCVWTSTSNSPNYLGDIEVTYGIPETILDTITSIESDLNNRIDEVEETLTEKVTDLENIVFTYQDVVRDVNTMQGTLDNATLYGILYSKEHFGISDTTISKVTIPYTTQSGQSNTGYLVAQVFGNDNQLIASYYSEGTHTFSNAGPAVFDFQDVHIASDYKFIRFILVADKTVTLPTYYNSINSNCLSFRAKPIKWQDSFEFDDDDCLSYSNQSTGTKNWLIEMTFTYKTREASSYITKTEDNEHILSVLNEEVDVSYAQGWFNLETNTNAWRLRIGLYPDIVAPDNGETLEAALWVQLINLADIPFEAYAITSVKVGIKAKYPGAQYCVSFKMYHSDNTLVTDLITYSGDTLELSGDPIKRIDYLASLNNSNGNSSNIDTSNFAKLNEDNTFIGNNNFTGNLTLDGNLVLTSGDLSNYATTSSLSSYLKKSDIGIYITLTWDNGTNWYRKYSDGRMEMGGKYHTTTSGGSALHVTVNLPTAFYNTLYDVFIQPLRLNTLTDYSSLYAGAFLRTSTSAFAVYLVAANGSQYIDGFVWTAKGRWAVNN